jgi:hypothetical protein
MIKKIQKDSKQEITKAHYRKSEYMQFNVILTFDGYDPNLDSQEIFDLSIRVSPYESDAVSFIMSKLFRRIEVKCERLGRRKQQLLKISTCANWDIFEAVTRKKSLPALGHSCKWYFGIGSKMLDIMETCAMAEFQFGTEVDRSNDDQWFKQHIAKIIAAHS